MVAIDSMEIPDSKLPEDAILQQEKKEEVEAVLRELAPLHRQLLIMKYEMELSYQRLQTYLACGWSKSKHRYIRPDNNLRKSMGVSENEATV